MRKILFAGGDRRTLSAVEYMKKQGFSIVTYALPHRRPIEDRNFSAVVLPFPCLKQGRLNAPLTETPPTLEEFLSETGIDPSITAIGGPIPDNPFSRYVDLSQREDLKARNAVPTAEGALELLMRHTDRTIWGMNCLIVGYGAVGKRLSTVLSSLGASVTVAARKGRDRLDAELRGWRTMDTKELHLQGFQAIFNTVPKVLLTESVLRESDSHAVFVELASPPGGIDRACEQSRFRTVIDGPALPGKVAPVTAGEDLAKTVIHILNTP